MDLSNNLVSQFVDVVNDPGKPVTNTDINGTVVEQNGVFTVRLDGSDIFTPVNATTEVKDGDRVLVKVIDHRAMIVGNATSPSIGAETAGGIAADALSKYDDKLDDKVVGVFDLVITERLDAKYATVENLTATNATIENLTARNAYIDNLIFGTAGGESISTQFSNSVVANLGDAQIKSAMILDLSADKIISGSIKTNNVQIVSDDGRMLIADETIQIRDANRARVQIGKDASGDYSINVWDKDGNLMFSEGGVTDKAIKKSIIRNDMISEDANISGGKIDIASLFSEMNDSGKTLKSSVVKFDDKNQTLDVVFKSMSDTVSGLENTTSTLGTSLSIVQGKIENKVWQQDIKTVTDPLGTSVSTLNTKYSTLSNTVNGLSNTVTSHTTQISAKADGSTVTTLSSKVSTLEHTASGLTVSVTESAKTATSYLKFDGDGLIVGDMTASKLGKNVLISSSGVDIRDGSTTLASFEHTAIYLGKNNTASTIDLMNGTGTIEKSGTYFKINSNSQIQLNSPSSVFLNATGDSYHAQMGIQSSTSYPTCIVALYQGNNGIASIAVDKNGVSVSGPFTVLDMLTVESTFSTHAGVEIHHNTPYIDFHYGNSSNDYTSRIIELSSGTLVVNGVQCASGGYLTASGASSFGSTLAIKGITTISKRIQPAADGNTSSYVQLGAESARFKYVYCMQSAMSTSDLNAKRDLTFIDDRYIRLFDLIEPYAYYFKNGDRVHTGFIAQYVEAAMEEVGLTAVELAFFCKNVKIEYEYDESGNYVSEHKVYDENGEPVYEYSLRYEEYIAIMAAKLKHMERKFEERLKALEEKEKQNG